MDNQEQLQKLLDTKACEEVLMRYGRTLDWLDEAGQESCFWPNAEIDYGFFQGNGSDWVPVVMEVEAAAPRRCRPRRPAAASRSPRRRGLRSSTTRRIRGAGAQVVVSLGSSFSRRI